MLDANARDRVQQSVIALRLILCAIAASVFFLVLIVFVTTDQAAWDNPGSLAVAALGGFIPALVGSMVIRSIMRRSSGTGSPSIHTPHDAIAQRIQMWRSSTIVGAAILESVAILMAVIYLVDPHPLLLIGAVALGAVILLHWPTFDRIASFVEKAHPERLR